MSQPMTEAAREASIQAAVDAAASAVAGSTGTAEEVSWKGSKQILPVASVDLDAVLLSPHSHRIKAQLESLQKAERDLVEQDPFGVAAQDIIADLLRETKGFERLKSALKNEGQKDAGVLTTKGVLVNANTRAVALRDLREKYVKVVVLPKDAGPKEITGLELSLQMEQDYKQDYSFTSQLLFIEDLVNSGDYTTEEVGRALKPALGTSVRDKKAAREHVELELRLLGLIRGVLAASGGALNFLFFDDMRQALIEIDQDYQKLKSSKADEAERIRDAQLAGMIAGVDYRRLREIDGTLMDDYVLPALEESALAPHLEALMTPASAGTTATAETPTGVGDFFGDDEDEEDGEKGSGTVGPVATVKPTLSGLYTALAKTTEDGDVALPPLKAGDAPTTMPRRVVKANLLNGLTTAIDNKKRDSRKIDDLLAPITHLRDATQALDKAATAYGASHQKNGFDQASFDEAVKKFDRASAAFVSTIGSSAAAPPPSTPPGDGAVAAAGGGTSDDGGDTSSA